jgi:hypothetical protein
MTDATKATTFDDIGSELNVFDTQTNQFVYRYVDKGRDFSQLVTPGEVVDLHDHAEPQRLIRGSGPEQMVVKNGMLFVSMLHSDKVEVFRVNQTPAALELHDANGALLRGNDNWRDNQEADIRNSGVAPSSESESAIIETLAPGAYTAVVAGKDNDTGVGLIEIFNLE